MFDRRRPTSDFSEELQAHLQIEIDRLRAEGLSEKDAYHAARRNLGNLSLAGERFYETSRWMWLEHLLGDLRYSVRRLIKAPAFAITAILTLALGIGATTSIFTLVNAVLLKSLPVANPDQLYRVGKEIHCCVWGGYGQGGEFSIFSHDLYKHLRDNAQGFEEFAAFQAGQSLLGVRRARTSNTADTYIGEFVSGNYFSMFGMPAYAGRAFLPSDDREGAPPVALMSYRVWQQKYSLDPSIIGETFHLNDAPFTIIGITPPGFYGETLRPDAPDFFMPLADEPLLQRDNSLLHQVNSHWLEIIGRLKPTTSPATAEGQLRVSLQQWLQSHVGEMSPNDRSQMANEKIYLTPGGSGVTSMRDEYKDWLKILLAVTGFVLMIVCANLANLMLVRGVERRQQTSLSMALGARPSRLISQALVESTLLSVLGGAAGLLIAYSGTRVILHFAFQSLSAPPIDPAPSLPVLLFAFGVSLITGLVFGIAPAWMSARVDPVEALRGGNRSTRQAGSLPRKTLVILQAALSLVLLSASGLLTASLRNLENRDFGFRTEDRTVISIYPIAGYKPTQLEGLYRRVRDSISAIPGVASVAVGLFSPQSGDSWNDLIFVEGRPAPGPKANISAGWDRVSVGFLETIGNPIVKGRTFTDRDTANAPKVAIVNEAFARKFFPDEDPIGKHFGRTDLKFSGTYEIVGISKDARFQTDNLRNKVRAFAFLPELQTFHYDQPSFALGETRSHYMHDVVVRMNSGATLLDAQVRRALAQADPNLPIIRVLSLKDQVAANFSQSRLIARLTSLFGILALALASIGLYGVTAYTVGTRTNEIGVRMALGAGRRDVLSLILRGAVIQIAVGVVLGVGLTLAAGRFLASQLFGISAKDPAVLAVSIAAIVVSALIAALVPAFRATSISPIRALRAE